MSAYWKAKGVSFGETIAIELSWSDRRSPEYRCSIFQDGKDHQLEFSSFASAEAWAESQGVESWEVVESVRVFPYAEQLPMFFPDAPELPILKAARAELEAGKKLKDIAVDFGVEPSKIRSWLRGVAPRDESIPVLRAHKIR